MTAVHFDASTTDDTRRQRLYAGDIFINSASDGSRAMAELAEEDAGKRLRTRTTRARSTANSRRKGLPRSWGR